jgi:hypothetical protein
MPDYSILYRNLAGNEGDVVVVESSRIIGLSFAEYVKMTDREFDTEVDAIKYLMKTNKELLTKTVKDAIDRFLSSTQGAKFCLDVNNF